MFTWEQIFVATLVGVVFVAFVREWLRPDLVAMGALILCLFVGIIDEHSLPFIFGRSAPIIIACMFILSAALDRTGLIEVMGGWFGKIAGGSEVRIIVVLVLIVAPLSAFINNTPVVVVFMPILLAHCRLHDLKASRFLIPLSYISIVGGTCTLIGTSTNLLAADVYQGAKELKGLAFADGSAVMQPFTMFEMAKLGIVFVGITSIYLLTIGRKLLPDRVTLSTLFESSQTREFLTQGSVGPDSKLIGRIVTETTLAKMRGVRIIEIRRDGDRVRTPLNQLELEAGDQVVFKSRVSGMVEISEDKLGLEMGLDRMSTESAVLMEGIVGPASGLVGNTLKELNFRQRFGVIILAVHRRGVNLKERFEDVRLAFGDTLLVQGPAEKMNRLFAEKDFVNLSEPKHQPLRRAKAPFALAAILGFMIFGAFSRQLEIPIIAFALAGVFLVLASRAIDAKEAYEAVEWKVIFMIFGMLGLGEALSSSGLASGVANIIKNAFQDNGPWILLSMMYLLAAILTEMISNNAVAALLTPLAVVIGIEMGYDPRPFVIAVMFGSSASFSTPIGYQTNTYVYGAGGYRFGDFVKAGLPLAIILWLTASFLIPQPWFWPFEKL
ncbi:MAG: di/tricarboxylate transporter [Verrucomicrobiales bacterium]|jgi:di/tricarboxylate transporter